MKMFSYSLKNLYYFVPVLCQSPGLVQRRQMQRECICLKPVAPTNNDKTVTAALCQLTCSIEKYLFFPEGQGMPWKQQ